MEDENIKNENSDINELVNRAMNDISQTEKNKESSDDTQNSEMEEVDSFNGDFHEKDSSTANDIVSEVKDSFIDYSMSVIVSRALPEEFYGPCMKKVILLINLIKNLLLLLVMLWDIIILMAIVLYMKQWFV